MINKDLFVYNCKRKGIQDEGKIEEFYKKASSCGKSHKKKSKGKKKISDIKKKAYLLGVQDAERIVSLLTESE